MEERICRDCGCVIAEGEGTIVYGDELVCESCLENNYIRCEECGECFDPDDMSMAHDIYGNEIYICRDCMDSCTYLECADCGEYHHRRNMTYTRDGYVCGECLDYHYTHCCECGDWVHNDYAFYDDYTDECYCEDCWDNRKSRPDRRIRDYHDNPCTHFYGELEFGRQHYVGFELEIDRKYVDRDAESRLLDRIEEIADRRLYFMHDGSLGEGGIEIISQPHTVSEIVNNLHMDKVMKACVDNGYLSHDVTTCGLHFHLSREMFGPEKYRAGSIQRMMLFYDTFYNEIVKIARRDSNQLRWCERCSWEDNVHLKDKERAAKYQEIDNHNYRHDDRYKVVNTTNRDTVEIRIMRGTLNYATFLASLDFVYTIARNSLKLSWRQTTNAKAWLQGLKPETIEYIKLRGAFLSELQ